MSLFVPSFFPRSLFDMDLWGPGPVGRSLMGSSPLTTLDLFDAFDDLDRMMERNIYWLHEPEAWSSSLPRVAEKYRITLDCEGFNPSSIKTDVKGNKLVVSATEGQASDTSDYSLREFRKSYDLPKYVDANKLVSFVTSNGMLVIEFPFKEIKPSKFQLQPVITESTEGNKRVEISTEIPDNIDPTKITVTCKDRDIIIKADYKVEKEEGAKSRVHYYRRSYLPENVDLNSIQCVLDDNRLTVVANVSSGIQKKVPIEFKKKEKMTQYAKEQQSQEIQSRESQMNIPEQKGSLKEPCPSCFQKSVPIESKGSELMTQRENEEKSQEAQTNIPEQKSSLKEQSRSGYQRNVPIESKGSELMTQRENEEKSQEAQTNIPEQKSSLKEQSRSGYQRNIPIESKGSEPMTEQKSQLKEPCPTCKSPTIKRG